jgi:hypothetical protein
MLSKPTKAPQTIKCRGSGSGSSGYYLIDLGLPFQDHFYAGKALAVSAV